MIGLIRSDIRRYGNGKSNWVVTAISAAYTHPSFIGVIWYRIAHALWLRRKNPLFFILFVINRFLYPIVRMYSGLDIPAKTRIGPGLFVTHFGPTVIHPYVEAGCNLTIEQGVTIGQGPTGVPRIGNDVYIGTGAKVINGITIGDHASVGAGAVVVKDVSAYCVAVGVPARQVKVHEKSQATADNTSIGLW